MMVYKQKPEVFILFLWQLFYEVNMLFPLKNLLKASENEFCKIPLGFFTHC